MAGWQTERNGAAEAAAKVAKLEAEAADAQKKSAFYRAQMSRMTITKSRVDNVLLQVRIPAALPMRYCALPVLLDMPRCDGRAGLGLACALRRCLWWGGRPRRRPSCTRRRRMRWRRATTVPPRRCRCGAVWSMAACVMGRGFHDNNTTPCHSADLTVPLITNVLTNRHWHTGPERFFRPRICPLKLIQQL